jgi:hypothetical protein
MWDDMKQMDLMAMAMGNKPPTTPGGRRLRFGPEDELTDEQDYGQLASIGAAGIPRKGTDDTNRMSRWDSMAAPEPEPVAMPTRKPVLPRVDIATAMAVAADKARTGKSLEELYAERGYNTSGSDDGFMGNLRLRAKQGDENAWKKLSFLAPGETPEALLTGTRREQQARAMRTAGEMARRQAEDAKTSAEQARTDRMAELQAGRTHQTSLAQMQIDAQGKMQAAQAEYNNKKLAVDEMLARGQIDQARWSQEMAKAQNERNNQLQEAQIGIQKEQLGLQREQFRTTAAQNDPMQSLKRTAMEASIAQAADQGTDPMEAFNKLATPTAPAQTATGGQTIPATKETLEAARQEMMGVTSAKDVGNVLAKYAPLVEGRPQLALQLMQIGKAKVPGLEGQMGEIARYAQSTSAKAISGVENSPILTLRPGAWLGRKLYSSLGAMPDASVNDARRWATAWDAFNQNPG